MVFAVAWLRSCTGHRTVPTPRVKRLVVVAPTAGETPANESGYTLEFQCWCQARFWAQMSSVQEGCI